MPWLFIHVMPATVASTRPFGTTRSTRATAVWMVVNGECTPLSTGGETTGHASAMHPSVSRGFTLIELLLVMGVIAVLLVACLPALTGLNSVNARHSAINRVIGVLDQARGIAISEGRNTYVAFVPTSQALDQSKWGRACTVYVEDGNFNLTQRTPWIYLPTGVSFKIDEGTGGVDTSILNRIADNQMPANAPLFPVQNGSGAAAVSLPYLKFDASGAVDEQNPQYSRVLIFQGYVNSAGAEVATKHTSGDQKYLLDEVLVNPATGRAKYLVDAADNLSTPAPTP